MIYPYSHYEYIIFCFKKQGGINMILHYNENGSIDMLLKVTGKIIKANFPTKNDYENFLSIFSI